MPGATVPLGFPYPLPADAFTRTDPSGLEALAEAVDAAMAALEASIAAVEIPPAALVNGGQQNVLNNTTTTLRYNSEQFDSDDPLADTVSVPTGLTIQTTGLYHLTGRLSWGGSTGLRHFEMLRNNTVLTRQYQQPSTTGLSSNCTSLANCTAGDVITMRIRHTQGATLAILGCDLSGVKVA